MATTLSFQPNLRHLAYSSAKSNGDITKVKIYMPEDTNGWVNGNVNRKIYIDGLAADFYSSKKVENGWLVSFKIHQSIFEESSRAFLCRDGFSQSRTEEGFTFYALKLPENISKDISTWNMLKLNGVPVPINNLEIAVKEGSQEEAWLTKIAEKKKAFILVEHSKDTHKELYTRFIELFNKNYGVDAQEWTSLISDANKLGDDWVIQVFNNIPEGCWLHFFAIFANHANHFYTRMNRSFCWDDHKEEFIAIAETVLLQSLQLSGEVDEERSMLGRVLQRLVRILDNTYTLQELFRGLRKYDMKDVLSILQLLSCYYGNSDKFRICLEELFDNSDQPKIMQLTLDLPCVSKTGYLVPINFRTEFYQLLKKDLPKKEAVESALMSAIAGSQYPNAYLSKNNVIKGLPRQNRKAILKRIYDLPNIKDMKDRQKKFQKSLKTFLDRLKVEQVIKQDSFITLCLKDVKDKTYKEILGKWIEAIDKDVQMDANQKNYLQISLKNLDNMCKRLWNTIVKERDLSEKLDKLKYLNI